MRIDGSITSQLQDAAQKAIHYDNSPYRPLFGAAIVLDLINELHIAWMERSDCEIERDSLYRQLERVSVVCTEMDSCCDDCRDQVIDIRGALKED